MSKTRVLIMGAAGRDFHNFNTVFRGNRRLRGRGVHRHADPEHRRPPLSPLNWPGKLYPQGIPIHPEERAEIADP